MIVTYAIQIQQSSLIMPAPVYIDFLQLVRKHQLPSSLSLSFSLSLPPSLSLSFLSLSQHVLTLHTYIKSAQCTTLSRTISLMHVTSTV